MKLKFQSLAKIGSFLICLLICLGYIGSATATTPPDLAGSLAGQFEVSQAGAATYSIEIAVPPGTNNLKPNLALVYNSSSESSPFGPGWNLAGLSEISRCPATLSPDGYVGEIRYDASDKFCVDGQRLVAISGAYGADGTEYRTRSESFSRVVSSGSHLGHGPQYFTVHLKNGLTYRYGYNPNSRHYNENTEILTWNLDQISDRLGNYLTVTYDQDIPNGQLLPLRIDYTGNSSAALTPYASVRFISDDSTNASTAFFLGRKYTLKRKINRIQTFVGENLVHSYELEYDYEIFTGNDRLTKISQCGADGICLPGTNFTWGENPQTVEQFAPNYMLDYPTPQYPNSEDNPVILGDWNGDGKSDFARMGANALNIYLSTGNGFSLTSSEGQFVRAGPQELYPFITGDWNGDGLTDIGRVDSHSVEFYRSSRTGGGLWYYGEIPDFGFYMYQQGHTLSDYESEERNPIITGDWNGDGRTDVARYDRDTLSGRIKFYVSNGTGFIYFGALGGAAESSVPLPGSSAGFRDKQLFTGDWNGDGLTDIGWSDNSTTWFYVSNGVNFVPCYNGNSYGPDYCATTGLGGQYSMGGPIYTGDWNGDGKTDVAVVGDSYMKLVPSLGDGRLWNGTALNSINNSTNADLSTRPIIIGDFNGDGRSDIAQVQNDAIRFYLTRTLSDYTLGFHEGASLAQFTPGQSFPNTGTHPFMQGDWDGDGVSDLGRATTEDFHFANHNGNSASKILRIVDGFGKSISINYGPLTNQYLYIPDTAYAYPSVDLTLPTSVVASYSVSDGVGGEGVVSYRYASLRYDFLKRQISGFGYIEATDQGVGRKTQSYYRQDDPYSGAVFRKEVRLLNDTLISKEEQDWNRQVFGSGSSERSFIYVSQRRSESNELDGSLVTNSIVNDVYDGYGNLTSSTKMYFDGSTESTLNNYDNFLNSWTLGQVNNITVVKQAAGAAAQSRVTIFHYLPSGLLQSEEIEPNYPQFKVTKAYSYDAFGNILTTTTSGLGVQTRVESAQYDLRGRFKSSVTNALNQTIQLQYDAGLGRLTQQTDPNDLVTQWQFDQFGRAKRELRSDGTELVTDYMRTATPPTAAVSYLIRVTESGRAPVITYLDLLGRDVRSETQGFDGTKILVDKIYNSKGELIQVSDPYFEGAARLWSVSEYDELGRVIRVTDPGNRISTKTYDGLTSVVSNALGQQQTKILNHRGLLESSTDDSGNVTNYSYDGYGNLIEIVDPNWNYTHFQYDRAGRKISVDDPNSAVTTFSYDVFGQLRTQTNAKNETITFSYDKLGRMTSRVRPEGTESWEYDTAAHGIGKLAVANGLDGYRESYNYDALGRVGSVVTKIGGTDYTVSQKYDLLSRVDTYTYASGFRLRYLYNARGFLTDIKRTDTGTSVWRPTVMNARGQIEQESFGNALATTSSYNPDTGYLQSRQTGNLSNLTFQFDSIGNLRERGDLSIGKTEQFSYDNLNRLTESHVLGQTPITVTYDILGNITSKSDVGVYTYNDIDGGPHAVTSITGPKPNVYNYDNAGNRFSSSDGQIEYSSSGKPIAIEKGTKRIEFDLNGGDQRVTERSFESGTLKETKVYLGSIYEEITLPKNIVQVHYIKGIDGLVAVYKRTVPRPLSSPVRSALLRTSHPTDAMNYLHLDHLGSIQLITNSAGMEVERLSFDSWGNRRDGVTWAAGPASSQIDRGFTGHEHLDPVSLIHMNGRVYDPIVGRFVSPDPFIESVDNLQALNPYSYVLNNPLSFTDPSGYFSFKKFWKKALKLGKTLVKAAVNYAAMYVGNMVAGPYGAAFMSSFSSALMNGGNIGQAFSAGLRGMPMGVVRSIVNFDIGSMTDGLGFIANATAHAIGEAGMAAISGGDVKSAMLGGFGASFGGLTNALFKDLPFGSIIAGGTATALGGGKFLDGAMRASFQYLYNDHLHGNPMLDIANRQAFGGGDYSGLQSSSFSFGSMFDQIGSGAWGLVGSLGQSVSDNSKLLLDISKGLNRAADKSPFFVDPILRFGSIMIGSVGIVGASPSNTAEAALLQKDMMKLVMNAGKMFPGGRLLTPQPMVNKNLPSPCCKMEPLF